jgi:hypothetical protein
MRAVRSRTRTFAGAGLLMTGALLTTACQPSDAAGVDNQSVSKPPASHAPSSKGPGSHAPSSKGPGSKGPSSKGPGSKGPSSSDKPHKGVNGTFSGVLKRVAPGKYAVGKQVFHVAKSTEVVGDGRICGKAHAGTATKCTLGQLEKAVQKGGVHAKVTVAKGIATRIVEQCPKNSGSGAPQQGGYSEGVNGTFSGTLKYVAPHEFKVHNQTFHVAKDTKIIGHGLICGSPHVNTAAKCTYDQLKKAGQKGRVPVKVTIAKGTASRIADFYRR